MLFSSIFTLLTTVMIPDFWLEVHWKVFLSSACAVREMMCVISRFCLLCGQWGEYVPGPGHCHDVWWWWEALGPRRLWRSSRQQSAHLPKPQQQHLQSRGPQTASRPAGTPQCSRTQTYRHTELCKGQCSQKNGYSLTEKSWKLHRNLNN